MKTTFYIVGRGLADWHAAGVDGEGNKMSVSGGDLEDTPWPYGGVKRGLLKDAPAGTPVYDAHDLTGDACHAFIDWVFTRAGDGYTSEMAAELIAGLRASVPGIKLGVVRGRGKSKRVEWEA